MQRIKQKGNRQTHQDKFNRKPGNWYTGSILCDAPVFGNGCKLVVKGSAHIKPDETYAEAIKRELPETRACWFMVNDF